MLRAHAFLLSRAQYVSFDTIRYPLDISFRYLDYLLIVVYPLAIETTQPTG